MEPYPFAVAGHLPGQRTATAFPCPFSWAVSCTACLVLCAAVGGCFQMFLGFLCSLMAGQIYHTMSITYLDEHSVNNSISCGGQKNRRPWYSLEPSVSVFVLYSAPVLQNRPGFSVLLPPLHKLFRRGIKTIPAGISLPVPAHLYLWSGRRPFGTTVSPWHCPAPFPCLKGTICRS